ncbi:MAG TPA: protein TolA [Paracoccus solventivorans]|uniref:protein TolA n=1 Tax=Paracoccus solventivorans TaxID=53463 RepID=UPI002B94AFFA|nr:protein TolA [Paracoccus solventivorans]HMM08803.1 protein TolA [Paracoccus solventivorans]
MADPFPPLETRERRIGLWVSAAAHGSLILWVALGGALFRAPQAPTLRMAPVETMSASDFEAMAAASRGAGPLGEDSAATPAQPRPPSAEVIAGGPTAMAPPVPEADPLALPAPEFAGEAAPNLSDLQTPQVPVTVATVAPAPQQPSTPADAQALPDAPVPPQPMPDPQRSATAPSLRVPGAVSPDEPPPEAPPAPPLLTTSAAPFDVAAARQRRADRIAQAEAAAAAAAAAAEAQRQAEAAEAARQAEQARIAAEAAAREQAERAAAQAAAEAARRAEAEARAALEAERQAALAAEQEEARRQAEAEAARAAEEQRLAEQHAAEEQRRLEEQLAEENARAEAARRRAEEEAAAAEAARALAQAEEEAARARAEAQAREQAEAARQAPDDPDPLLQALAEAMDLPEGAGSDGGGGRAAMGPPLSQGEKDGLRLRIEACWNIGSLSREAQRTSVSVQFSMTPDGMPEPDSVRLVESQGGSEAAAAQAFEAARRAILRCAMQGQGYDLPAEKYARWRDTIVDFRPQGGAAIR